MNPTRRDVLVTIAALAAPPVSAEPALLTAPELATLTSLVDTIIPRTDTPGASDAGVPAFIETMLAEWYEPSDWQDFMNGMGVFAGAARIQFGKPFPELAPEEQDLLLTQAMTGKIPGLSTSFFEHCRQLVVLGYYTSEIGCKQERVYVPVPGRYDGKYPFADVRRVFAS